MDERVLGLPGLPQLLSLGVGGRELEERLRSEVGVEGGVVDRNLLELEAVAALGLVVGAGHPHVYDGELLDGVYAGGKDVLHLRLLPCFGLPGLVHEGLDVEGNDLAQVEGAHDGVDPLVPVEFGLFLLVDIELDERDGAAAVDLFKKGLGVGVLYYLLAGLRLLVGRVGVPPADTQDGGGEAGLAPGSGSL